MRGRAGRARTTGVLIVAFLLPAVVLAVLGWRELDDVARRARLRHREQAEALAESVVGRVRDELARLARGELDGARAVRFGADGTWLGARPERAEEDRAPRSALELALRADVDELQRAGELERACERLRGASEHPDEGLAAWALESLAAFERLAGRPAAERAVLVQLVERFPRARDERGLVRSFVARLRLSEAQVAAEEVLREGGAPPHVRLDLVALHEEIVADWTDLSQLATAHLLERVEQRLVAGPDVLARCIAARETRAGELRFLASIPRGISDWIARGAPGGLAEHELLPVPFFHLDAPPRPGQDRVLVQVRAQGDTWAGWAVPTDELLATSGALAARDPASSALGFAPAFEDGRGARLALLGESYVAEGEPSAACALPAPLSALSVTVRGGDLPGTLRGEQRRRRLTLALVGVVLVGALAAAFATLRAVAREGAAARGREAFVAAVTHELKAPLASIRLFAEMLAAGGVEPERVREFGARTVGESDRLVRLVDGVLALARLEQGAPARPAEAIDLGELARAVTDGWADAARERGFELALATPDEPLVARGERDALASALANLVDNALKYSDRPHRIEVVLRRLSPERAELAVLDRGRGIAREDAERVFAPFARLGDELTRDRPGVGLGLALVSRVARAHGGSARVEPRAGGGSRFVLELPLEEPS